MQDLCVYVCGLEEEEAAGLAGGWQWREEMLI